MKYTPPHRCYWIVNSITQETIECLNLYFFEYQCIENVVPMFFHGFFKHDIEGQFVDYVEKLINAVNSVMVPEILERMYEHIKSCGQLNYHILFQKIRFLHEYKPILSDRIYTITKWPCIYQNIIEMNSLSEYLDDLTLNVIDEMFYQFSICPYEKQGQNSVFSKTFEMFIGGKHLNIAAFLRIGSYKRIFNFNNFTFCEIQYTILQKYGYTINKFCLFMAALSFDISKYSTSPIEKWTVCKWSKVESNFLQTITNTKMFFEVINGIFDFVRLTNKRKFEEDHVFLSASELRLISKFCLTHDYYPMLDALFRFLPVDSQTTILKMKSFYYFMTLQTYEYCFADRELKNSLQFMYLQLSYDEAVLKIALQLNAITPYSALKITKFPVDEMKKLVSVHQLYDVENFHIKHFTRFLKWIEEFDKTTTIRMIKLFTKFIQHDCWQKNIPNIFTLFEDRLNVNVNLYSLKCLVENNFLQVNNFKTLNSALLQATPKKTFLYIWRNFIRSNTKNRLQFWTLISKCPKDKRRIILKDFILHLKKKDIQMIFTEKMRILKLGKWSWKYIEQYDVDSITGIEDYILFLLENEEYQRIKKLHKSYPFQV